jgi:hypothetical protein
MPRLAQTDIDTVINFLRDKIESDDLSQIGEILAGNADPAAQDEPPPFPGRPRPGGTIDPPARAMDSGRREFEKQHGIQGRKIRVLG